MKRLLFAILMLTMFVHSKAQTYQADWESLKNYEVPEWYADAKLGFWPIWGVYSLPAFKGNHAAEWYGRWMYCKPGQSNALGDATYQHHIDTYGDQSKFGYKDFIPMFTAEKFDANEWAELCVAGGAKFLCALGIFHDGFNMGASEVTRWNAVEMGPKRDILAELAKAARKKGLKYGVSNHLGWNYMFYLWNHVNKFDAVDPETRDLYGNPVISKDLSNVRWHEGEQRQKEWLPKFVPYVKPSQKDLDLWLKRTTEMCDLYKPDLYYFDWGFNIAEYESNRKEFGAHYYNKAVEWRKGKYGDPGVVLNYKQQAFPDGSAVNDRERGVSPKIQTMVWQTDDSVYDGHNWGYAKGVKIKSLNSVIDKMLDIVSKNGVLMLAFAPKGDGSFPDDQKEFIYGMGEWMKICGEAVYATRPWKQSCEDCKSATGGKSTRVIFTRSKNDRVLYATMLNWGESVVVSSTVKNEPGHKVKRVSLVGSKARVDWKQTDAGLEIVMLSDKPSYDYAYPIKIEWAR